MTTLPDPAPSVAAPPDLEAYGRLALIGAKARKISDMCAVYAFGAVQRDARRIILEEVGEIAGLTDGLTDGLPDVMGLGGPGFITGLDE